MKSIIDLVRRSSLARLAARRTRAASVSARAKTRARCLDSRDIVEDSRDVRARVLADKLIDRSQDAARRRVADGATQSSPAERYERPAGGAKIRRA